jgi:hypothetical protein
MIPDNEFKDEHENALLLNFHFHLDEEETTRRKLLVLHTELKALEWEYLLCPHLPHA